MNKSLLKDTLREIWNTKSRFFAILAIILIGVAFFAGLVATSPVMKETANTYFNEQELPDIQAISTLGFTDEDIDQLSEVSDATVDTHMMVDVLTEDNQVLRFFSYDDDQETNQYVVNEGRLPEESHEIALDDNDEFRENFEVGDTIHLQTDTNFDNTENVTETEYEIVGFVQAPIFIENESRGNTNIGSGSVDGFAVVTDEAIDLDEVNLAHIRLDEFEDSRDVYSSTYADRLDEHVEDYEEAFDGRAEEKQEDLIDEANEELDSARSEVQDARDELESNRQDLEEAREELDLAWDELQEQEEDLDGARALYGPYSEVVLAAEAEIDQGRAELEAAEEELESNQAEFEEAEADAQQEIEEAEADIEEAEEEVSDLEDMSASINFTPSLDFPGINEYGENADRIASIARVFPLFFFALALLISLTTMSRIVDEGRGQIGTMKALGYNNTQISIKYFTYAALATVVGSILGLLLGFWLFPTVIVDAYGTQYQMIDAQLSFYPGIAAIAFIGAVLATGIATFMSLRSLLKNNAATLLRPKSPKSGQRTLLERVPFIWNRLSFTHKVSARNLFRYKGRMIMTIIGVAGGMALMLTGFGLYDSLQDIGELQYDEISNYEAISVVDTSASEEDIESVEDTIANSDITDDFIRVSSEDLTIDTSSGQEDLTLMSAEESGELEEYVTLRDYDTEEQMDLPDDGAFITQKVAELAEISVGDTVTVEDNDGQDFDVEIAGIVENYVEHYLYMSPEYRDTFDDDYELDTRLIQYGDNEVSDEDEANLEDGLVEMEANMAIVFHSDSRQMVEDSLSALDAVMVVLILSAALLSLVVLYNLTNINVSERVRELSTIKVLGFFDGEVTRYVYRETFTQTLIGILFGIGAGYFLHQYIIETVELNFLMFSRNIQPLSYLYASGLMIIFSIIVMVLMHFKLKNIDMVEALKTAD